MSVIVKVCSNNSFFFCLFTFLFSSPYFHLVRYIIAVEIVKCFFVTNCHSSIIPTQNLLLENKIPTHGSTLFCLLLFNQSI